MVLIFFTLFSAAYLLLPDSPKALQTPPTHTTTNTAWSNTATNTVIQDKEKSLPPVKVENDKQASPSLQITTTTELATTTTEIINPINTTIQINDQKYNLKLKENATAYDAMQQLATDQKITATMKEYKGMGYFLEEINGIKNDNQNNKYWIYYINGQSAQMGISSYVLKNNDLITWKYENSKF